MRPLVSSFGVHLFCKQFIGIAAVGLIVGPAQHHHFVNIERICQVAELVVDFGTAADDGIGTKRFQPSPVGICIGIGGSRFRGLDCSEVAFLAQHFPVRS